LPNTHQKPFGLLGFCLGGWKKAINLNNIWGFLLQFRKQLKCRPDRYRFVYYRNKTFVAVCNAWETNSTDDMEYQGTIKVTVLEKILFFLQTFCGRSRSTANTVILQIWCCCKP
jgi:hypothetical protein